MTTTTNTKTFTKILVSLAAMAVALTGLGLTAAPASARPQIDPYVFDLELPSVGFNEVPLYEQPSLTAEVAVNCSPYPQVRVDISNTTEDSHLVEVFADGEFVSSVLIGPNMDHFIALNFAENDSKEIRVESGDSLMFEDTVEMDCVFAEPGYEVIEDCDTGQAYVRLINSGDDSVVMGVAFPNVMYAPENIAPHSSIDWLLPSSADGPVEFDVKADGVVIGHEIVEMDCEVLAEVEAAKESSDPTQTVDPEAAETDADGDSDKLSAGVDIEVDPGSGSSPWVALAATMGGLALLAGVAVAWSRRQGTVG